MSGQCVQQGLGERLRRGHGGGVGVGVTREVCGHPGLGAPVVRTKGASPGKEKTSAPLTCLRG